MDLKRVSVQRNTILAIGRAGIEVDDKSKTMVSRLLEEMTRAGKSAPSKQAVCRAFNSIKRKRFVRWDWTGKRWQLSLTKQGELELSGYEMLEKLIRIPKKWDGKWRALIFDIREEKKYIRDRVRHTLFTFGFYRLQDSVWVFPYDCEEVLELLRTKYRIRYGAQFLLVERLSNDRCLRQHFHLIP